MNVRYASLVESGTQWLEVIPAHWRVARLYQLATAWTSNVDKHSVEGQSPVRLCNYTDVYKNDAIVQSMEFMRATATTDQIARFRLRRGDTIITKDSETPDDIGIPAYVDYEADDLICGYHLAIIRPNRDLVVPRFLFWAMSAKPTFGQWEVLASGVTRVGIRSTDLTKAAIALPSVPEQKAIADFLDRETVRIDALVKEQEGLVAVLQERRAALIARVLVSGLDSNVPVEPSRVDWLGDLPAHWRTVPTRYLCKITTGSEDSGNAEDDGEYPFFVRGREILRIGHYSFDCEAVMTPGDGQGGTGKVFHYFNGKFEAHQRVYVYKDFKDLLGRYYFYFLSTFLRPVALAGSNTVTMESLRRPVLADFPVALPPVEEQRRIVAYLEEQTDKIDALIAEAEGIVAVAKERRSALVTAAVTGQIDVRGEVA
ncbi:restriction endonuclease subunit S [Blastococcus sp. BMG 814]|uniref:Restriction endonuclease subunit S n=1 Tax=Blastococcus carthaginiensis TaxID=3050034 RepID=A0ABT9I9K0_9ACTN|nr:restriction endonuclease subunit S [Blastococcus carthaginiensis]MDP5182246.1 restriction endonuclease subunit S [Blastococcus carthaginiensis]